MTPLIYSPKPGEREQQLAVQTGLSICNEWLSDQHQQYLFYHQDCLSVGLSPAQREHPVCVDFAALLGNRQRGKELLLKAIGGRQPGMQIVDATAGLGRDSALLASYGAQVTLCERNPVVAALLQDGLLRGEQSAPDIAEIVSRMTLIRDSASHYLNSINEQEKPGIIYLDPMFPESGKSALVKKEMRLFHDLVGKDDDADELLALALQKAEYRVVVKRPPKAPVLGEARADLPRPQLAVAGKAVRFDLYPLKALPK
ncbi:class I SAM-dependent methyltransferase [Spongiibacter sp. KMU-158]|uniref:Ribosomal RNA small subunit methyltransferase J n=1 Tax=Spongiibacter pelagi TaxID=2760804 RepID=A0A927BZ87_9GAMM|nr:class I SAM-dependent methyltransferase [Spongiibacter pelagi]MBD2858314.1 class I SAM-dependent methyltransferase [Spongiibacter pelagi]